MTVPRSRSRMLPPITAGGGRAQFIADFVASEQENVESVNGSTPMVTPADFYPDFDGGPNIPLLMAQGRWQAGATNTPPAIDGNLWFSATLGTGAQQMYRRGATGTFMMPIAAPGASFNFPYTQDHADKGIFIPAKTWAPGSTLMVRMVGLLNNTGVAAGSGLAGDRFPSFIVEPNGNIYTAANLNNGGGTNRVTLERTAGPFIPTGIAANTVIETLITGYTFLNSDYGAPPTFRHSQIWTINHFINHLVPFVATVNFGGSSVTTMNVPLRITGTAFRDTNGFDYWNSNTELGLRFGLDVYDLGLATIEYRTCQAWIQKGPWA